MKYEAYVESVKDRGRWELYWAMKQSRKPGQFMALLDTMWDLGVHCPKCGRPLEECECGQ